MNEEMQIQIIELIDQGATLENSSDLRELVNSSDEAKTFYESILVSESAIKGFFGGHKAKELHHKIDAYVDEQLNEISKVSSINFKPILGFAPLPVAPSSLISPPEPVAAPGYGEIAVG